MNKINNAISPVPIPNNIGAIIPPMVPANKVTITKIKIKNSNSFGNFILTEEFNIWGVKAKISKKMFVEAMCQR